MEWVSVNKKLPEKSGAHLTISRYGEFMVLPYSVRHKAFNAYDHSTEEYVAKHKKNRCFLLDRNPTSTGGVLRMNDIDYNE